MRTEISQAKREASFYLENVGKGKAIAAMEERKSKKRKLEKTEVRTILLLCVFSKPNVVGMEERKEFL